MKNILLIGVGGTGSNAVDMLYRKIATLGKNADNKITALVFDTDKGDIEKISSATAIPMADNRLVGSICDSIGAESLREWFPYKDENVRAQEMIRGASQWRKKSFLAFVNLMNKPQLRSAFHNALDDMRDSNPSSSYEIYTIASIAGGTGSGSFIPITLYAKKYIKEKLGRDVQSSAVLACPDIYSEVQTSLDNKTKVYSNAYAILRELNAINLVTHGYNMPSASAKDHHPPVRLRIGHETSPVGLLFDASKEAFWEPGAAPFNKVFLLDKIPGLNSIQAHDVVLANSLYTVLCTEIGSSIDSEVSNHAMLNTQNNGYNAIYAGIATSELRFPVDSVLDYMAHRKTLEASNEEWMIIHRDTEMRIREEQKIAKESRRVYTENEGDYADKYLISVREQMEDPNSNLAEIIRRGTEIIRVVDGKSDSEKRIDGYVKRLLAELKGRLPSGEEQRSKYVNPADFALAKAKAFESADRKREHLEEFVSNVVTPAVLDLTEYYKDCATVIHNTANSLADNILTFDPHKELNGNETLSLVGNLLMNGTRYIHPVAGMVQLCALQKELRSHINYGVSEWTDLRRCEAIAELPVDFYTANEDGVSVDPRAAKKSAYNQLGNERMQKIATNGGDEYTNLGKSDTSADLVLFLADVSATIDTIKDGARVQLLNLVLKKVCSRLEALITQYRRFFNNLEEERENLREKTETALRANGGNSGSVINVASDVKSKLRMFEQLNEVGSAPSMEDILNVENIAGKGVFDMAYASVQDSLDAASGKTNFRKEGFSSLFDGMIKSYREQISRSQAYQKLAGRNVFEIIAENCGKRATKDEILRAEQRVISSLIELARPSLMVDNYRPDDGTPPPSTVTVILMSSKIARYLKRNAAAFELSVDDDKNEDAASRACAEQFIVNAGGYGVRIAIVDEIPANVVYVTSEIIDVQPTHISKIDETSANSVYFNYYKSAVNNMERYETDMWNPHLSFNLHKRGYLPYINPTLEAENDKKLVKALLYALIEGKLTYHKPLRQPLAFRYFVDGVERQIIDMDGQVVDEKNLSALVSWLRPQAALIDEWSGAFDANIKAQLSALPQVTSTEDLPLLEARITTSEYISVMRKNLFAKINANKDEKSRTDMSLIEFAYAVKTSEEATHDCDDAEKILAVVFEIFCSFCSFRLPIVKDSGRYASVYTQQLDGFMEDMRKNVIANARKGTDEKKGSAESKVEAICEWVNSTGTFRSISEQNMFNADGSIRYEPYKFAPKAKDTKSKAKADAADTTAEE